MKTLFPACFLLFHFFANSQDLVIEPSRTSGSAPLYVFFDATSSTGLDGVNDLPNADFSWDFDLNNNDESGKWELTKGMVAGHVFEAPGTYTVSCTVIARNGTVDTEEVTITVSEFSGTTYYVSNDGSDSNDGLSEANSWATANFALSNLGADTRILFRRGDTFEGIEQRIRNLNEGVKRLGAYGTGADPILSNALGRTVLDIDNSTDIAAMDLHLFVNSSTDGSSNNSNRGFRVQESTHVLGLRLEIENAASFATYQDDGDALGIFDCDIHDIGALGIFSSDSRRFSWVGNSIDGMTTGQPEHCMRIQGGEKQFVAHSTYSNIPDVKTSITVRGDGQRHIMIYKNRMDRIVQIAPTDHEVIQFVSLATIEGNYIGANPAYQDTNFPPPISAINLISTEIVVRNNVIDGLRRGVTITVEHPAVVPGDIDIYNNTMNWRNVMEASGNSGTMVSCSNAVNVNIRNNLMSASSQDELRMYGGDDNTNLVESNNLKTITPDYVTSELPGSAAHQNNATNFKLLETSAGIDQGAFDVPVHFDQTGAKRYYGSAPDIGAFEFDDGGEVSNPDPSEPKEEPLISDVSRLLIYPNPTSNYLTLFSNEAIGKVEIIDLQGHSQAIKLVGHKIDITSLPAGTYVLRLKNYKNEIIATKRIIRK